MKRVGRKGKLKRIFIQGTPFHWAQPFCLSCFQWIILFLSGLVPLLNYLTWNFLIQHSDSGILPGLADLAKRLSMPSTQVQTRTQAGLMIIIVMLLPSIQPSCLSSSGAAVRVLSTFHCASGAIVLWS